MIFDRRLGFVIWILVAFLYRIELCSVLDSDKSVLYILIPATFHGLRFTVMAMSGKKCCVPGCGLNSKILHKFPNPDKDMDRFRTWIYNVGGDILAEDNEYIFRNRRVCHLHFEVKYHTRSKMLSANAVPTLNLTKFSFVKKPPQIDITNQYLNSPPAIPSTSDGEDNSKMCRVCGKNNITLIHLFSEEASYNNLVQKINNYLPIVVDLHDKLPLGVCQPCVTAVLNWHSLVQCCIKTDKLLALTLIHTSQLQSKESSNYKPNGENSTRNDDAKARLSTNYLILILKEVLNDYFKILNVDEDNSDLMYVCQMCPENPPSTSIECLHDHLISSHSRELCDKSAIETFVKENITFEEVLNNDEVSDAESEKQVADIPNYYCPYCESVFSSPTRLICHLNKHVKVSIDDGVLCCNSLYSDKKSFVLHLQEKHVNKTTETELICKTCGSVAENTEALEIHINEKHSDVGYQKKKVKPNPNCQTSIPAVCPECNKTFANKYTMLKHMESHTNVTNSEFACDKCNKTYKSRSNLNQHHRVFHEGRLPFLCPICGEGFPKRMTRDNHARIHTGFKPFTCQYCNKSYRAQNTLDCHIQMHLNIRKYECHLCPKRFRKKSHLDCHLKSHFRLRRGGGSSVCHICGKQLCTPKGLQRHLKETHERPRSFICAVCSKNFANAQNLKQHIRIHTGERPYVCPQCGKRFSQSKLLHVHLQTHGAQLPHLCAECGARFRLRSGLTRHCLRHSGERQPTPRAATPL